jgi:hypothetical protein
MQSDDIDPKRQFLGGKAVPILAQAALRKLPGELPGELPAILLQVVWALTLIEKLADDLE